MVETNKQTKKCMAVSTFSYNYQWHSENCYLDFKGKKRVAIKQKNL